MTDTAQNILKTLGYFDLFEYPLTKAEIYLFISEDISHEAFENILNTLVKDKSVFILDEFYAIQNNCQLATRRRKGNELAARQLKTANRVARLLARFPYVKAIAVSGSLSKNFATEKTDIDFFIVTTANRLWIARTILHLYKKLTFLTGRQNWFCMNYFVDEACMEIVEKNIFTAIEIFTLLPMQGKSSLTAFAAKNSWIKNYFPLHVFNSATAPEIKNGFLRTIIENFFNGSIGDTIDKKLMAVTQRRWQKKVQHNRLNSRGGSMGMVVDRHFSKPDPKNFQEKVVEGYRIKVQQILQQKNKSAPLIF